MEAEKVLLGKHRFKRCRSSVSVKKRLASAAKGQSLAAMGTRLSQLPLQPPMLSPKHENNKDDIPLVTKELIYSKCPVDGPRELLKACQTMTQITGMLVITFIKKGIALQRQQTALQVQQNWIVELLAVNKIRASFPSLVYVSLMGTLWTITVLFRPFELDRILHPLCYRKAITFSSILPEMLESW